MFNAQPEFKIEITSQTRYLKMVVELTKNIALFIGFSPDEAQKIALALDEAVTNIIKHSYLDASDQKVLIEYYLNSAGIKIRLIYQGIPPEIIESGKNVQELIKEKKRGGLGVKLMKSIMDSVSYSTESGNNYCEMIKWKKSS